MPTKKKTKTVKQPEEKPGVVQQIVDSVAPILRMVFTFVLIMVGRRRATDF